MRSLGLLVLFLSLSNFAFSETLLEAQAAPNTEQQTGTVADPAAATADCLKPTTFMPNHPCETAGYSLVTEANKSMTKCPLGTCFADPSKAGSLSGDCQCVNGVFSCPPGTMGYTPGATCGAEGYQGTSK